ncbi:hypothetical protein BB558_001171 [Smittium angustum]|uniref:DBF4-type domain-containing protein n=1 Tax=Smittium angustum TaxID=133377 RepID=A0A2U1JCI2_SMIAN|nr:hypothetical protein BB558_001171 [Smittium angustum]
MANRKLSFQASINQISESPNKTPDIYFPPNIPPLLNNNPSTFGSPWLSIPHKPKISLLPLNKNPPNPPQSPDPDIYNSPKTVHVIQDNAPSTLTHSKLPSLPQFQKMPSIQNNLFQNSLIKTPISEKISINSQTTLPKNREVQKAKLQEWIIAYRRAFPTFRFYFDNVPENTVKSLSISVKTLSAKVESFFSVDQVTHVIISDEAASNLSNLSLPDSSNVVAIAKKFNLKIWSVDKLRNRILKFLLPANQTPDSQQSRVLGKRNLNEVLQEEKLSIQGTVSGAGTTSDFYFFKYNFILVEDADHIHKPILMNDYRPTASGNEPPWPKLYYVPVGRCPFVRHDDSTSDKDSDSDSTTDSSTATDSRSKSVSSQACYHNNQEKLLRNQTNPQLVEAGDNSRLKRKIDSEEQTAIIEVMGNEQILPRNVELLRAIGSTVLVNSAASGAANINSVTSTITLNRSIPPERLLSKTANMHKNRIEQLSRLEQAISPYQKTNLYNQDVNSRSTKDGSPYPGASIAGSIANIETYVKSLDTGMSPNDFPNRDIKPLVRYNLPPPQTKKPVPQPRQTVVSRPGYCENCRLKYDDMMEHIQSAVHRTFADDDSNWKELDELLNSKKSQLDLSSEAKFGYPVGLSSSSLFDTNSPQMVGNSGSFGYLSGGTNQKQQDPYYPEMARFKHPQNHQTPVRTMIPNNFEGTVRNPITIFETSSHCSSDMVNSLTNQNQNQTRNLYTPQASCLSNIVATPSCDFQFLQTPNTKMMAMNFPRMKQFAPPESNSLPGSSFMHSIPTNPSNAGLSRQLLSASSKTSLQSGNSIFSIMENNKGSQMGQSWNNNNGLEYHEGNSAISETPTQQQQPYNAMDGTTVVNSRAYPSLPTSFSQNAMLNYPTPTKSYGNSTQTLSIPGYQQGQWNNMGDLLTFSNSKSQDWNGVYNAPVKNATPATPHTTEYDVDRSTSY